ncbi:MAG TPA: hypothetical protein VHZ29_19430 [Rhizomicrobium sp.]|jgi:hypothetical protein|nr:hypothetical protein [Rhizomicrobium sp.]
MAVLADVAPCIGARLSTTTTRLYRGASACAMKAPLIPAPTTTTSALIESRKAPYRSRVTS